MNLKKKTQWRPKLLKPVSGFINHFREGSDIDLIIISEDFIGRDYWSRIDVLSAAIYDVFAPIEVVGFTPAEWEKQTSPLYDYARQGEILYAAGQS